MNILSPHQELPRFKFFNLLAITSITIQLACNCIVGKLSIFFMVFYQQALWYILYVMLWVILSQTSMDTVYREN